MKIANLGAHLATFLILGLPLSAQTHVSKSSSEAPALIEQLLELNSMSTFYAGTFKVTEFPPLDEAPLKDYPLPSDTPPDQIAFRAMIRLVELGPAALPDLLKGMNDQRATKTEVTDEYAKSLGPSAYVDFRRGDRRDEAAIRAAGLPRSNPGPDFDEAIEDYTLTVGDVCFSLIGMITNRSYYLVVDEFDAQLNSPTRSEKIGKAVTAKWGAHPGTLDLYIQLKNDLEQGEPRYSNAAARRLLYYFPRQCENLIIAHLGKLNFEHEAGRDDLAEFIKAIVWSPNERIASTLRRFLVTATDAGQIAAASSVYGKSSDPRGYQQLLQLADRLKLRRDPAYVDASRVILGLNLLSFPNEKDQTVTHFLKGAGAYANTSALLVCEGVVDAPIEPLAPLLKIKSKSTGDKYLVKGEGAEKWPENDDYLPYRICDRAYETISRLLGDKETHATGLHEEMDLKIEKLGKRLDGKRSDWKFTESEIKARQKAQNKFKKTEN